MLCLPVSVCLVVFCTCEVAMDALRFRARGIDKHICGELSLVEFTVDGQPQVSYIHWKDPIMLIGQEVNADWAGRVVPTSKSWLWEGTSKAKLQMLKFVAKLPFLAN